MPAVRVRPGPPIRPIGKRQDPSLEIRSRGALVALTALMAAVALAVVLGALARATS